MHSGSEDSSAISSANNQPLGMDSRSGLRFVTFLTFVRFPLVLLFFAGAVVYAEYRRTWLFALALGSLIASAVTDIFDGYFARKFNVETKFGAHADPLMDKFFYLVTLPLLVFVATKNGHIAHAIFLLVLTLFFLTRDQWVTFLRSIGSMYNVSGGANWSGKLRTCVNFPLICAIYHFEESPTPLISAWFLHSFEAIAFVINLVSLYIYTHRYWPYLHRSANRVFGELGMKVKTAEHEKAAVEQNLFRAQKMESLSTMATGTAHSFNNLLAAILGNARAVIRDLPAESPAKVSAQEIEATALHAVELTDQIMSYASRGKLEAKDFDISALVKAMTGPLNDSISKGVSIEYQLADDLPAVNGDPTRIRQVIMNLVMNAWDAMVDKTGTITISTGIMKCDRAYLVETYLDEDLPEGQYVYVEVSDTGCGMTPELQDKIFDPFFTTRIRGKGMGLSAAVGVIRGHGGAIKIQSEPGKGSTLRVLLSCSGSRSSEA